MLRPTRARIDLGRLRRNAALARRLAPASRVLAVIKADAYGHGAVPVAQALEPLCEGMAVATLEEASALREAGIRAPLLLLEGVFGAGELPIAAELDLMLVVHQQEQLGWLREARLSRPLHCWLKVDTGMHRLGFAPAQLPAAWQTLSACASVAGPIVLCSHLGNAEAAASERTGEQIRRMDAAAASLPESVPQSLANSAALLNHPRTHRDWVRPGYLLFGDSPLPPGAAHPALAELAPVMRFESTVIAVREIERGEAVGYGERWIAQRPSRIATVAAGYADGYPCNPGPGACALIGGRPAPLAGRVSMDMLMLDVTALPPVQPGDPVLLWGDGLAVGEVARRAGTIGYELLAGMPARVPRLIEDSP